MDNPTLSRALAAAARELTDAAGHTGPDWLMPVGMALHAAADTIADAPESNGALSELGRELIGITQVAPNHQCLTAYYCQANADTYVCTLERGHTGDHGAPETIKCRRSFTGRFGPCELPALHEGPCRFARRVELVR